MTDREEALKFIKQWKQELIMMSSVDNADNVINTICKALEAKELDELRQEVERLRALTEWQPIDTYKIDKGMVIIFCPTLKEKVLMSYLDWDSCTKDYLWTDDSGEEYEPTHWMPLPNPPQIEGK